MTNFTYTLSLDASCLSVTRSQEHNSSTKNTFQTLKIACLELHSEIPKTVFISGYFASHRMNLDREVGVKDQQNHPSIRYSFGFIFLLQLLFFPFPIFISILHWSSAHREFQSHLPCLNSTHIPSLPFLCVLPRLYSHSTNPLEFHVLIPNAPNIRTCSLSSPSLSLFTL